MIAFLLIISSDYIFIHRTELKTTIIKQLSKYIDFVFVSSNTINK